MTAGHQLAKRFREVFLDGTWIANTNFKHQLADVSLKQATTKIADLNTIALLTCHVNYYVAGVLQVFQGGSLDIRDQLSFDFEPPKTDAEWQQMMSELLTNAEVFAKHVEQMTDKALQGQFVKEDYGTYQRNIEGMIEHAYYHLGQISLIIKLAKK